MKITTKEQQRLADIPVQLPPVIVEPEQKSTIRALASDVRDWGWDYVQAGPFHEAGHTGKNCLIAVIDTGVDDTHEDLRGKVVYRKDYVNDGSASKDPNGHGTWCASRIAALANGKGVIGIAPDAGIVDYRFLGASGSGSMLGAVKAILDFADLQVPGYQNAFKIASMSFGSSAGAQSLRDALEYAVSKGVIFVGAAGNSGYQEGQNRVGFPAAYDDLVLAVAAIDQNEDPASFTSGGPAVDVAAPGVRVLGAYKNGGYAWLQGTSMACPHVAACVALLYNKYNIRFSHADAEVYMQQYAKDLFTDGWDYVTGSGSVILTQYTGKPGEGGNPNPPDNPNPPTDPPTEPEPPVKIPERMRKDTVDPVYSLGSAVFPFFYKTESQGAFIVGVIKDVKVRVASSYDTSLMGKATREFIQIFNAGRFIVLADWMDEFEAGLWWGVFAQFIADDSWVVDRFGTAIPLQIESITFSDLNGTEHVIDQDHIRNRVTELKNHVSEFGTLEGFGVRCYAR